MQERQALPVVAALGALGPIREITSLLQISVPSPLTGGSPCPWGCHGDEGDAGLSAELGAPIEGSLRVGEGEGEASRGRGAGRKQGGPPAAREQRDCKAQP